jgi:integrase
MPKLTERTIATAKPREKPYRLSDGDGLLLEVRPGGAKAWTLRFMRDGKRRDMSLGSYPTIGLAEARAKVREARGSIESGTDPIDARQRLREAARAEALAAEAVLAEKAANSFRAIAEEYIAIRRSGWTSQRTYDSWRWSMDSYILPQIGDIAVAELSREDVIGVLRQVWQSMPKNARKFQQRIGQIIGFAMARSLRTMANPATSEVLRLSEVFPEQPSQGRQPSLDWQRVPAFLAQLDDMDGIAALALRWTVLTALRSTEVREARWSEFDLAHRLWTIPGYRMKGGKRDRSLPHRVPLSDQVLALLGRVASQASGSSVQDLTRHAALQGQALLFPSSKPDRPLSDAAMSACIKRMNEVPEGQPMPWVSPEGRAVVPHGFRSSFRTWVDDNRPGDGDAAEAALAHRDANQVRAVYRRGDHLTARVELMQAWADYCTRKKAEVVPLPRTRKRSEGTGEA